MKVTTEVKADILLVQDVSFTLRILKMFYLHILHIAGNTN